jgi:molybdopterin-guanine dinucleotide biosynthesis protein B
MKTIGFIGYSNSGKTTLIEKLVPLFIGRGLRVAAIKHAHHGFDMDRPGKDSFRYRVAGAQQVLIATAERWALLTETPRPAALADLLAELAPCDLVIVEGFRGEGTFPRIEVRRTSNIEPPLFPHDPNVIAVAADHPVDTTLPVLDLNDAAKIAAFVASHLDLP